MKFNIQGLSYSQARIMAFAFTDYDFLICDGAIRTGKSSIEMIAYIDWAMRNFNGMRFGISGKTVGSAYKNLIFPYMSTNYAKKRYMLKYVGGDKKELTVSNGKHTNIFELFGGHDESSYETIQGRTLAGMFFDEVALQPKSFVEQALARLSISGSKGWFSCNPVGPKHWFFLEWILNAEKQNALYLHFNLDDNPALSELIKERYKRMYVGVFYQRYILGKWVLAEGLVYSRFSEKENCFDEAPFLDEFGNIKHGSEMYVSIDYGIVNPFAAYLWVVYNKVAYCWKEYYYNSRELQEQKTDEEHYEALEQLIGGAYIDSIIVDPSATSFKLTIKRHGKFNVKNAKNEVIAGISTTASLLNANLIKINKNCKHMLEEFSLYSWNEKDDVESVIKENDHAMDSLRYFAYTILRKKFNWLKWGD